ncbi:2-dehydropantoate 2-reductase [Burkholderia multivorans]|nr:2-dehydropantoate 2-reductase [Burkholderia multivorans]CAB5301231.1 2-dehydropantoate 2-reductase [Burkholderia multivorans]CAB5305316.1 2-dehydropantoate 2-reductase [Burkholderia multivorans]CAB5310730.1 2-dehydropantoate 2-reductase [Burkholderia multivorans]CAB5312485.1 2-dehydropantoate 2-reductase [Burkholderia multivorans]
MLKVCVFGGGAIGGYLAGHLARAGRCEVSVVARGATLTAIRENGIRVHTPEGTFNVRVRASEDAREFGPQDYVFIALKAHQVDDALENIAALIGSQTVVLPPTTGLPYYFFHRAAGPFAQARLPGIDPHDNQWRALPPDQVLGCVYWIGAHSSEPGVVEQDGTMAGCPIGELDGQHSERATVLADLLSASGIPSKVNDDIRAAIWVKFVNSLCWNPVAVLTQATLGEMADANGVVPLVHAMMEEADALAKRVGVNVRPEPGRRIALTLRAPSHKMSMLQDLEAGRPLELDPLRASLRAISELTQMSTPTLDAVLALAGLRAQRPAK